MKTDTDRDAPTIPPPLPTDSATPQSPWVGVGLAWTAAVLIGLVGARAVFECVFHADGYDGDHADAITRGLGFAWPASALALATLGRRAGLRWPTALVAGSALVIAIATAMLPYRMVLGASEVNYKSIAVAALAGVATSWLLIAGIRHLKASLPNTPSPSDAPQ